jgi:hypothetical protein
MTSGPDATLRADDVPAADAAEPHRPVDISDEDAGLRPGQLTNVAQKDANPADLIDQAIIVPLPDEDREAAVNE